MSAKTRRRTPQKQAVRAALQASQGFVSAPALHQQLAASGTPVGLATVYRRLNALVDAGDADALTVTGGGQLFRACESDHHHHHLVCEKCGKTVEIRPPVEEWINTVAAEHDFEVTNHVFEVFGRCASCRAR